jgi:hypothetical protein
MRLSEGGPFNRATMRQLAAIIVACASLSQANALITNAGFENGTLTPWVLTAGNVNSGIGTSNPKEGANYALIGVNSSFTPETVTLSNDFTLGSSTNLSLHFFAQRTEASGVDDLSLVFEVYLDSTLMSTALPTYSGSTVQYALWQSYDLTTASPLAPGSHTLSFVFTRAASLYARGPKLALDDVSLVAVPEPVSSLLLGIGAALFVWHRRRK